MDDRATGDPARLTLISCTLTNNRAGVINNAAVVVGCSPGAAAAAAGVASRPPAVAAEPLSSTSSSLHSRHVAAATSKSEPILTRRACLVRRNLASAPGTRVELESSWFDPPS